MCWACRRAAPPPRGPTPGRGCWPTWAGEEIRCRLSPGTSHYRGGDLSSAPRSPSMSELDVFAIALDLTDPAERAAYLEKACGGDALLRQRIELLLNTHARADDFMARPAAAPAATVEEEAS